MKGTFRPLQFAHRFTRSCFEHAEIDGCGQAALVVVVVPLCGDGNKMAESKIYDYASRNREIPRLVSFTV